MPGFFSPPCLGPFPPLPVGQPCPKMITVVVVEAAWPVLFGKRLSLLIKRNWTGFFGALPQRQGSADKSYSIGISERLPKRSCKMFSRAACVTYRRELW